MQLYIQKVKLTISAKDCLRSEGGPCVAAVHVGGDRSCRQMQYPHIVSLPLYCLHFSCCSVKWRRHNCKTQSTYLKLRKGYMDTQKHERKVTGNEKDQSFIAVNKNFGLCDLHDYIRALGSQAEIKWKRLPWSAS